MSDRKNVNKYYPPDYDPSKGSLNSQLGQHPLRKRAAKLASEGILVVRFELPFNAWCLGCGAHLGKGVRYNADKQQVSGSELTQDSILAAARGESSSGGDGKYKASEGYKNVDGGLRYFSTKIWQFSMTCHLCMHPLVIRTSPKEAQYIMHSGIRAKDESFSASDNNTMELLSSEERARVRTDALFATEHGEGDKKAAAAENAIVGQLFARNERLASGGDFSANGALRATLRAAKKQDAAAAAAGRSRGIGLPLLAPSHDDEMRSALVDFRQPREIAQQQHALKRIRLAESSIFDAAHTGGREASSASSSAAAASSTSVAAAASAATPRARAIQQALASGIDVRALAPLPHAPVALYSSRTAPLLGSSSAKLPLVRVGPPSGAASSSAAVPREKKRKRAGEISAADAAVAADTTASAPAASGGLLGLSAYDSDEE